MSHTWTRTFWDNVRNLPQVYFGSRYGSCIFIGGHPPSDTPILQNENLFPFDTSGRVLLSEFEDFEEHFNTFYGEDVLMVDFDPVPTQPQHTFAPLSLLLQSKVHEYLTLAREPHTWFGAIGVQILGPLFGTVGLQYDISANNFSVTNVFDITESYSINYLNNSQLAFNVDLPSPLSDILGLTKPRINPSHWFTFVEASRPDGIGGISRVSAFTTGTVSHNGTVFEFSGETASFIIPDDGGGHFGNLVFDVNVELCVGFSSFDMGDPEALPYFPSVYHSP
jgi:hypothetical protein